MKKFIFSKEKNLILINFSLVFSEIETELLNDLDKFGLIDDFQINLSKRDTKKLIYHHIIHGLCEEIKLNKHKYKKAIIISSKLTKNTQISEFCDIDEFNLFTEKLIKRLNNLLPFVIYNTNETLFDYNIDKSRFNEIIEIINQLCVDKTTKLFTYEKIKKFSKQFELEFLSRDYFNSIKNKSLLY